MKHCRFIAAIFERRHTNDYIRRRCPSLRTRLDCDEALMDEFRGSRSNIHSYASTITMAVVTALCMAFTVFFAYNSSVEQPYLSLFVTKKPERSILILNIASQITIFCLAELTSLVSDWFRWALLRSHGGTSALTFLVLSRMTNIFGALFLSFFPSKTHSHRKWGLQRYDLQNAADTEWP